MIEDCKKYRIKSVLNEMVQDGQKRKHRKLGHVSLEDNIYEDIANIYATEDKDLEVSGPMHLEKVRVQEEAVEIAEKSIAESRP